MLVLLQCTTNMARAAATATAKFTGTLSPFTTLASHDQALQRSTGHPMALRSYKPRARTATAYNCINAWGQSCRWTVTQIGLNRWQSKRQSDSEEDRGQQSNYETEREGMSNDSPAGLNPNALSHLQHWLWTVVILKGPAKVVFFHHPSVCNLVSPKSSLSISEHLGVMSH